MRRGEWSKQLAAKLGNSSPSADTVHFIAAWTACENTRAKYNPLATSLHVDGDSDFNGIVRNYPDAETGLNATVTTLQGRFAGYQEIREGIQKNNPEMALQGLYKSPWGTSGLCVDVRFHGSSANLEDEYLPSFPSPEEMGNALEAYGETNKTQIENDTPLDAAQQAISGIVPDTSQYGRRLAYIIGGGAMVLVATILAIRSLVPTEQIVKTVAAVA